VEQEKHILLNNSSQILIKYYLSLIDSLANSLHDELQKQEFQNYNKLKNYEIQNAERLIIQ
jgi:hypothetical protein